MGGAHVRDPVAHRLVDGVLQRARARIDPANLGAQQAHALHVRRLAGHVLGAHVDHAVEAELRADGGGGHAVLAGPGLRDHAGLAHALHQQGLAQRVVDLVGARVAQVLALQVEAQPEASREALRVGEGRGPAHEIAQEALQVLAEGGVAPGLGVGRLELAEGLHERLRHVAAAVGAEAAGRIGTRRVREGRRHRPASERAPHAARVHRLHERAQLPFVLAAGARLDPARHVDRVGAHHRDGLRHVVRAQPPRENQEGHPLAQAAGQRPVEGRAGAAGKVRAVRVEKQPEARVRVGQGVLGSEVGAHPKTLDARGAASARRAAGVSSSPWSWSTSRPTTSAVRPSSSAEAPTNTPTRVTKEGTSAAMAAAASGVT